MTSQGVQGDERKAQDCFSVLRNRQDTGSVSVQKGSTELEFMPKTCKGP